MLKSSSFPNSKNAEKVLSILFFLSGIRHFVFGEEQRGSPEHQEDLLLDEGWPGTEHRDESAQEHAAFSSLS